MPSEPRPSQPSPTLPVPIDEEVGAYRITRLLGRGGMATVYEAVNPDTGERVAIKLLSPDYATDPEIVQRFFNEARAARMLEHPGLVRIFDLGTLPSGRAYLRMELLEGEPLRNRLRRLGRLPAGDALRLTRQIAEALAAAHQQGVVHRDLKPGNVVLCPEPGGPPGSERPKVLDFGVAKIAAAADPGEEAHLRTTTGAMLGTPAYMSPEQCRSSGQVDAKSDVYSLGVMFFEMLTGRLPFADTNAGELIARHLYQRPPGVRALAPEVSTEVETLVSTMLAKDPAERPTMGEVVELLEGRGPSRAWFSQRRWRLWRGRYLNRQSLLGAVIAALLLVSTGLTWSLLRRPADPRPPQAGSAGPADLGAPPPADLARPAPDLREPSPPPRPTPPRPAPVKKRPRGPVVKKKPPGLEVPVVR